MCPFKELSLVQHVCKFIHFVISEEHLRMLCNYMIIQTDVTNILQIHLIIIGIIYHTGIKFRGVQIFMDFVVAYPRK